MQIMKKHSDNITHYKFGANLMRFAEVAQTYE